MKKTCSCCKGQRGILQHCPNRAGRDHWGTLDGTKPLSHVPCPVCPNSKGYTTAEDRAAWYRSFKL